MSEQSDPDLTALPEGCRWITWDIGTTELQKSVMTVETFEALRDGVTNVKRIRDRIRLKRKLFVRDPKGEWTDNPSERFVNEHAWVLSMMNQFEMIEKVDQRSHQTALLTGAEEKLPAVVAFFQRNEPFEWKPGTYKRVPGW